MIVVTERVITKSKQQNTDFAGERLLRGVLEPLPLGWVVNKVEGGKDFGIDFHVQVFNGASPTGAWFHVQLKSSTASNYSGDKAFISQGLSTHHARHYAKEMRDPILVVHADLASQSIFWYAPQLDQSLAKAIASTARKSVKVKIPTQQVLPITAPLLLSSLENICLVFGLRATASSTTNSFVDSLKHMSDQQTFFKSFHEKNDAIKLNKIKEFFLDRQFIDARTRINVLQSDPDSSVSAKFLAQILLRGIEHKECLHSGRPQIELAGIELKHAKEMQRLAARGPDYLKFYALIVRHAADLSALTNEAAGLFLAMSQHMERGGNPLMVLNLYARKLVLTKSIIFKYNQCLRLARYASKYKNRWMLGEALGSVVNAISIYLITLNYDHNMAAEKALAQSAFQICKLAGWIGNETGDVNSIILSIISALGLSGSIESEAYRWADLVARKLPNEQDRRDALGVIDRAARRRKGEKVEGDYHGDTVWQIIQNISSTLGIDLDNENDPIVQSLRIAARDNNPGRVMVKCESLLVTAGAVGPRALWIKQVFNLGTASHKVIHCTLHDYHTEGKEIDIAFKDFKQSYCDSCPDCKPRPAGWRCTDKIKNEFEARHFEFIMRLAGTGYDMRITDKD